MLELQSPLRFTVRLFVVRQLRVRQDDVAGNGRAEAEGGDWIRRAGCGTDTELENDAVEGARPRELITEWRTHRFFQLARPDSAFLTSHPCITTSLIVKLRCFGSLFFKPV